MCVGVHMGVLGGCVEWVCWSGVRAKWLVATQNVRTCNFMFHLFLSYSTINKKKKIVLL